MRMFSTLGHVQMSANTAVGTASLLIVLRVYIFSTHYASDPLESRVIRIAVWNRNRIVYFISMSAWIANFSCLILGKSFL